MVSTIDHTTRARRAYSRRQSCRAIAEALEERTLFSLLGIGALLDVPETSVIGLNGSLHYSASTHSFDATATPIDMQTAVSDPNVIGGDMQLHISVANSGSLLGSGSQANDFTLTGTVDVSAAQDGSAVYTGTLLTGTVQEFGFQDVGGGVTDFDFDFKVTGGTMATAFFTNKDIGISITAENSTFTSFNSDFQGLTKGLVGSIPQQGNPPPISISGHKYQDMTGNGLTADDKNHPIAGVTIQLYKDANADGIPQAGELVTTTTTDASGAYSFTGLPAGTYMLTEAIPGGFVETAPASGLYTVVATAGPYTGFDFDNYKCTCDCNSGCNFNPCGNNNYCNNNYNCGSYNNNCNPNPCGGNFNYNCGSSYSNNNYNCGSYNNNCNPNPCNPNPCSGPGRTLTQAPSSLAGSVFVDCNKDGNRDSNEQGIKGVTITLTGTNLLGNNVTLTTTTDANGNYKFSNLIAGTYTLTETDPDGYADGQEHVGTLGGTAANDVISNILVPPCSDGTCYTFGELKTTCVSGHTGHGGCQVTLTGCDEQGHKVRCQVTTDCHGDYNFKNICGGRYTVTECNSRGYSTGYCENTNVNWSSQACSFSFGGFQDCDNNHRWFNW